MASWNYFMLFVLVAAHAASVQTTTEDCKSSADGDSCESQFEKSSLLQTRVSPSLSLVDKGDPKTTKAFADSSKEACPDCIVGSAMALIGSTLWNFEGTCCGCVNAGYSWTWRDYNKSEQWCYYHRFAPGKEGYILDTKDCPEAQDKPCPKWRKPKPTSEACKNGKSKEEVRECKKFMKKYRKSVKKCRSCEKRCKSKVQQKKKRCKKCMKKCQLPRETPKLPGPMDILTGLLNDPMVQAAMQNPNITNAIQGIMANPEVIVTYAKNPEIMGFVLTIVQKIVAKDPDMFAGLLKDEKVQAMLTPDIEKAMKEIMSSDPADIARDIAKYVDDPKIIDFILEIMQKIMGS